MIKRLPTPVFVVGYGALVIACIVFVSMLFSYSSAEGASGGTSTRTTSPEPLYAWNPAPRDEDNVGASVRNYLITDVETSVTYSGVTMRGEITPAAEQSLPEFTGHVSRLLEQNCLDALVLRTEDNFRLSFLGFCFSTLSDTTIAALLEPALDGDADELTIKNHNSQLGIEATTTWLNVASDRLLDELGETWEKQKRRPDGVDWLSYRAFGKERFRTYDLQKGAKAKAIEGPLFTTFE